MGQVDRAAEGAPRCLAQEADRAAETRARQVNAASKLVDGGPGSPKSAETLAAVIDATAIAELHADLERLFRRTRELESQTVARAAQSGSRAFPGMWFASWMQVGGPASNDLRKGVTASRWRPNVQAACRRRR